MPDIEQQEGAIAPEAKVMAPVKHRRAPPPPPPREKMAHCLAKMQSRRYDSWRDRVQSELLVVGTHLFDLCSSKTYGEHTAVFSGLMCALVTASFAYQAGAYLDPQQGRGPGTLHGYFVDNADLDAGFLRQWGASYGPDTRRQAYRILTYALLHQNLLHLVGNLLIFGLVGFSLEHRSGIHRQARGMRALATREARKGFPLLAFLNVARAFSASALVRKAYHHLSSAVAPLPTLPAAAMRFQPDLPLWPEGGLSTRTQTICMLAHTQYIAAAGTAPSPWRS